MAEFREGALDPAEELNRLLNLEVEAAGNAQAAEYLRDNVIPDLVRAWLENFVKMPPRAGDLLAAQRQLKLLWAMKRLVERGADRSGARASRMAAEREQAARAAEEELESADV